MKIQPMPIETSERHQISWAETTPGTWRLIIWEVDEDGESQVRDIIESDNRRWLEREFLKRMTPWAGKKETK